MAAMKENCRKRDTLLIVDEAQTGLGRRGDLFAIEHEGVVPDVLTLRKTLGNKLPLSAVITSNEIARVTEKRNFVFSTTHANDPFPAAVGLKVSDTVLQEGSARRAKAIGAQRHAGLHRLMKKYACIGDVRGRGLMAGVEIVSDRETKTTEIEFWKRLSARMMELGLSATISAKTTFSGCIKIPPPLTITEDELAEGLMIFEEA